MQTGIVLIAIEGHGGNFYYNLAYNMALSIKAHSPNVPICLITDTLKLEALTDKQKEIFDYTTVALEEHYFENYLINPFMLKTFLYKYSPFENTLYLDSDGLVLKPLDTLFEKLNDVDFQIHEVNRYTKENAGQSGLIWTKPSNSEQHFPSLWEAYELDADAVIAEYNSSFIWFKKTPDNENYFNLAQKNYFDRRVRWKDLGKSYPDEMAWNITSAQLKYYGKYDGFKPCYLNWETGVKDLQEIINDYWVLSMASGYQPTKQTMYYDNLVKMYRSSKGDNQPFKFEMLKKIFFRK